MMSCLLRVSLGVMTCSVVLAALVSQGAAQPAPSARADSLFQQGKDALAAGKVAEACAAFEESNQIDPKVTTLANLANCREKNQQLATALALFSSVEEQLRGTSDPGGAALREVAQQRVTALTQRASRLVLTVEAPDTPELEVLRDGIALSRAQWTEAFFVDGGQILLVARAPGHQEWSRTVQVAPEGAVEAVTVPALRPDAPSQPETAQVAVTAPVESPRRSLVLPLALGAAAVVLGGVAIATDVTAQGLQSDAEMEGRSGNLARATELNEQANSRRDLAQGLGVVAGLTAGAAVVTYFVTGRRSSARSASARQVTPLWGRGVAGVALGGSW